MTRQRVILALVAVGALVVVVALVFTAHEREAQRFAEERARLIDEMRLLPPPRPAGLPADGTPAFIEAISGDAGLRRQFRDYVVEVRLWSKRRLDMEQRLKEMGVPPRPGEVLSVEEIDPVPDPDADPLSPRGTHLPV